MTESTDHPDDETTRPLPDDGTEPTTRLEQETPEAPRATRPSYDDSTGDSPEAPTAGRHPVKIGYLVAGLLALGLALVWLLAETGVVDRPANDSVGVSLVLITAGLAGLLASVGRMTRRHP